MLIIFRLFFEEVSSEVVVSLCPVCPLEGSTLFCNFTLSAPSTTAGQTDLCGAISQPAITPEYPSGCDTPIPIMRI